MMRWSVDAEVGYTITKDQQQNNVDGAWQVGFIVGMNDS
jgi:hypothetical protein